MDSSFGYIHSIQKWSTTFLVKIVTIYALIQSAKDVKRVIDNSLQFLSGTKTDV